MFLSFRMSAGSYPTSSGENFRMGSRPLPGRLDHAGDLPVERELAECDTGDAEFADEATRAAAHRTAVADAGGGRIARQLLQLLLRGVELVVAGRRADEDGLQFGTLGGVLGGELDALLVA